VSEEQAVTKGGDTSPGAENRKGVVIGILIAVLAALVVFFVAHSVG
jgi:hypothetical protein